MLVFKLAPLRKIVVVVELKQMGNTTSSTTGTSGAKTFQIKHFHLYYIGLFT